MTGSQRASARWRMALLAVLLVGLGMWLGGGPPLEAQDDGGPAAGEEAAHLYLPSVSAGVSGQFVAGTVIPGQYIVVLKDPAVRAANAPDGQVESAASFADRTVSTYGGQVLQTYETALSGFAATLPDDAVAALTADPNVAYVEPDKVITIDVSQTPATWGIDRIDQLTLPLNNTYVYNTAAANVHAYIIDTGIRPTHQEFGGRMNGGYTVITDTNGTNDCNGHGTHVAGTLGGTTYGVAKRVLLYPVRVLGCNGSGSTSGVIAGVDWVSANRVLPAVANMSLGGSASTALDTAVRNSVAMSVTFAVAAGNENQNACNTSPSRVAEAITVAASTSSDARASYSNFGTCVKIFAPGSNIVSSYYSSDVMTATLSGTSMASPHVAGAAALYLSLFPNASPNQVMNALVGNASAGRLSSVGTGSPNKLLYTGFIGNDGGGTPPPTSTPIATPTPTPTPVPGACTNLLANPGYEQGRTAWTESSLRGYILICTSTSCGTGIAPRTGSYLGWLGGGNNETGELRQTVALPAGKPAYLSYWYQIASTDYCGYDYGYVRIVVDGVTRTLKTYSLCSSTKTTSWTNGSLDVSAYAGKSVTLIFRAKTDASYLSSFFVDGTSLANNSTCPASVTAAGVGEDGGGEDIAESAAAKPEVPAGAEESHR